MLRKLVPGALLSLAVLLTPGAAAAQSCDDCTWQMGFSFGGGGDTCYGCSWNGNYGTCNAVPWGQGIGTQCDYATCPEHPETCRECIYFLGGEPCTGLALTASSLSPAGTVVAQAARVRSDGVTVSACGGFIVTRVRVSAELAVRNDFASKAHSGLRREIRI